MRSRAHRPSRIALAGALLLVTSIASAPGSSVASTDCVTDPDPARQTQIKSGHVLFAGNIAEVAIRPNAAFGSTIPNATLQGLGFHPTSSGAGLLADRNRDGCFDAIDGEFFMPGTDYEGWALRVGSRTHHNNHSRTDITGGEFSELLDGADTGTHSVTWTATTTEDVRITKVISMADTSQRVRVQVELVNDGESDVTDVYYGRGVDPDNDNFATSDADFVALVEEVTGNSPGAFSQFRSLNTVVANPEGAEGGTGTFAQVSAAFPGGATLSLIADDARARASREPSGFNTMPVLADAWAGTGRHITVVGSTAFGDNGMNLAFNIGTLAAGASTNFEFSYTLSDTDVVAAGGAAAGSAPPPPPPPPPPTAPPAPAPAPPSPAPEPGGGLPAVAPGTTTGAVDGAPVVPEPSRPSGGAAEFRVGTVETRVDVAVAGAGAVDGSDGAPVIRAVRDRVATITGGGMRPGTTAQVWMPLPDGASRQVALLPVAADGTFDGALPFTGELDGGGPLPIGDRTIQLFGRDADGKLTVINFGVRIEQPDPLTPEPDRDRGVVPTLSPGQSLATNAGLPTPVTVTPLPEVRSTRIEGDGWLMDVDVPGGEVIDDGGAPLIEIVNGTDSIVRGTGFMAGTRAYVWLMSDPTFLGEVTVGADGAFSGAVPIAGVEPGEHTLQLSGVGTDGFVRATNLGVVLTGDGTPVPRRIDAGGGPVPLVPLSMLLVVALLGAVALTTERGRALAATGAAEHSARLDAHARHRLPAFDALQQRLTEQRRALRSRD